MREAITINENSTLLEAFLLMKENNVKEVVVVNKENEYRGILRERDIIFEKNLKEKVKKHVKIFAKVDTDEISKVAKAMYENDLYTIPYVKNKKVIGVFYIDELLDYISKNIDLKNIAAQTIMSQRLIVASPQTKISKAIRIFAENNISHLPIIENGKLVAILSRRDIIEKIFKPKERVTIGELSGEKLNLLENPIISIASKPVITFSKKEKLYELIKRMKENNISCLVEKNLEGIVTKKDFLKVLIEEKIEKINVNISGINVLDEIQKEQLRKYINNFCKKAIKINAKELQISIKKISYQRDYYILKVFCKIENKPIYANSEGFSFLDVLQSLFDKLERLAFEEIENIEDKKLKEARKKLIIEYLKSF